MDWLGQHAPAIQALAAVGIFLLTGALVWATWKYARLVEEQLAIISQQSTSEPLGLYIVDSHIRKLVPSESRLYLFRVMVTNKSSMNNSLKDLQLVIEYKRQQGPLSNIAISHNPDFAADLSETPKDLLRVPCQIAPHTVLGGVALFKVPEAQLRDCRIESYTLKSIDSNDLETELEVVLLQELAK